MFYKLLLYDLKNGFRSIYRRYMTAAAAFIMMFVCSMIVIYGYNTQAKPVTPVEGCILMRRNER